MSHSPNGGAEKPPTATAAGGMRAASFKFCVLAILVVQNASASLLMRRSRLQQSDVKWNPLTGVIIQEIMKALVCVVLMLLEGAGAFERAFLDRREAAKTAVPAVLYLLQNNLQYVAVTYLDASTYAVLYQLKIISTGLLSVCLLGRHLSNSQWNALLLLTCGVAAAVVSQVNDDGTSRGLSGGSLALGLAAVLSACFTSGLAGVSFEKLLKRSSLSLWARNLQLALFSILVGWCSLLGSGGSCAEVLQDFFKGYNSVVWLSLANNALGGLLIAVVIQKADNILKNFATSLSIILTATVSVAIGDSSLNMLFCTGATMVMYAVFLYGTSDPLFLFRVFQNKKSSKQLD